ncbi:MAG: hypothetical protein OXH52_20660 [Gammaproteobacteria bacterium]|nr:hypothetical protein [Gammaproteobacteria bacterium]
MVDERGRAASGADRRRSRGTSVEQTLPGSASAWWRWRFAILLGLGLLAACQPDATDEAPAEPGVAPEISRVTEEGPVTATVALAPAAPRLGDPLKLTLTVEARPGVRIEMPDFGEALGRYSILDFMPRLSTGDDGGVMARQEYTLRGPASGRQRIPGLRIEYVDERGGDATPRELITDELAFEIESVLPEGAVADTLRSARGHLPELGARWWSRWLWLMLGAALAAGIAWGVVTWRRQAAERARATAFERALQRLGALEERGLPEASAVDAWYVELSDIVRRYIEDRHAVRAPELTTEEFLLEARRSVAFSPAHRDLLSTFLGSCDRVKFARYSPGADESRSALEAARRFLGEAESDFAEAA